MSLAHKLRFYSRVVLHAFEMTMRSNLTDAFVLFGILVQPVLIAILAFWMLQGRGGDYVIFVVVGSGMTGLWTTVLFSSGNSVRRERNLGTLEFLVASPTPLQVVIFGKNLANVVQSLGSMILSYTLAIVVFGYAPQVNAPIQFLVSLVLGVGSYVAFGLLIAPLFVLNPEVQRWQNGLEFPVYILSGFLFPIALLPGWTTPFSYLLVPYWAARALHTTSSGAAALPESLFNWGMMVGFSLLYVILSRWLFRKLLHRARTDATLGLQ